MRKDLIGVVQVLLVKKRFLASFQDGCKNNLYSNQLTILVVEKIPEKKEPEVTKISDIPKEKLELEKGCHRCVYVMLRF